MFSQGKKLLFKLTKLSFNRGGAGRSGRRKIIAVFLAVLIPALPFLESCSGGGSSNAPNEPATTGTAFSSKSI